MKHNYLVIITLVLALCHCMVANASGKSVTLASVKIDTDTYLLNDETKRATLKSVSELKFGATKVYDIPQSVSFNNTTYEVDTIGADVFYGKTLRRVTIPSTVDVIKHNVFYGATIDSLIITDSDKALWTENKTHNLGPAGDAISYKSFGGTYKYIYVGRYVNLRGREYISNSIGFHGSVSTSRSYDDAIAETIDVSPNYDDIELVGIEKATKVNILKSDRAAGRIRFCNCDELNIYRNFSDFKILEQDAASIKTLKLGEDVKSLPSGFIESLTNLQSLSIGKSFEAFTSAQLKKLKNVSEFVIDPGNKYYSYEDGLLYNGDKTTLITILCPDGTKFDKITLPATLSTIADSAFVNIECDCVEAPALVNVGEYAFYNSGLNNLVTDSKIRNIGKYAFFKCPIRSLNLDSGIVEIPDCAFYYCQEFVVNDGFFTHLKFIGERSFCGCISINNDITLEDVVVLKEGAFSVTSIKSVDIRGALIAIEDYTFSGCYKLENVTLPNSLKSIGERAFADSGLKFIDLGNNVETISSRAFWCCKNLVDVDLGENICEIHNGAFYKCGLKTVRIGSALKSIESGAFRGNNDMETIYCNNTNPASIFKDSLSDCYNSTLRIPCGAKERYLMAPYWNCFSNIVEDGSLSGSDEVMVDGEEGAGYLPVVYYDLSGCCVENPVRGIYIKRQGSKVEKVVIQ